MEYSHTCVKPGCGKTYKDNDPDEYYCPECLREKKAIAKRIDKQFKGRVIKKTPSLLQQYDAAPKIRGFARADSF